MLETEEKWFFEKAIGRLIEEIRLTIRDFRLTWLKIPRDKRILGAWVVITVVSLLSVTFLIWAFFLRR